MDIITPADTAHSVIERPAAIPDQVFSEATIVYLGFNDEKASEIWDRWTNWPASPPRREIDPDDGDLEMLFFDWVTGFINEWDVVWESHHEWELFVNVDNSVTETLIPF